MDITDGLIGICIGLVCGFVMGMAAGSNHTRNAFERDCQNIGAHVVRGEVYDCKLRTK